MRHRVSVICLSFALLVPAPAALAQTGGGGAFGPLPQSAPPPAPTPTPVKNSSQDEIGRGTLLLIALGVAVVFVALGIGVTRDARRNLTESDRLAIERGESGTRAAGQQRDLSKAKTRRKQKAARAARKRTIRNR